MKTFSNFLEKKNKSKKAISESYSLNIEKPTGYGTFLTAKQLGIHFEGAFALHPTVENELKECQTCKKINRQCKCEDKNEF